MLIKTILITTFGLLASLALISEYFKKPLLGYITKPILIPLLGLFYYFASNKIDLFIIASLTTSFIAFLYMLKSNKAFNKTVMIFMSLFSLLFSIAILKTNYFLQYIPEWFYIYMIIILLIFYFFYRKISAKISKNTKIIVLSLLVSNAILAFVVLCRVWRFRSLLLLLPIIGVLLIAIFSMLFIFNNYNKEIKNGNLLILAVNVYGQLMLVLGVMADW